MNSFPAKLGDAGFLGFADSDLGDQQRVGYRNPQVTRLRASDPTLARACWCHSESERRAYARIFVSVAINRRMLS